VLHGPRPSLALLFASSSRHLNRARPAVAPRG
jgi:hypothetical protein